MTAPPSKREAMLARRAEVSAAHPEITMAAELEIHVTTCPFLDQSPEEVLAAIDASRAKLSALSDELTTEARAFWQRWESP